METVRTLRAHGRFGAGKDRILALMAAICALLGSACAGGQQFTESSGPPPGYIVVDPNHPQWLKYQGGGPFFMCGPGDPEGFLYRGSRNSDGTRNGDQMSLINKLKGTRANCIYLMAVRSHGGDGDSTQNPFINSDPSSALDEDILNQWETWFTEMDNSGIVIYFFFYDDSARIWNTGDNVGPQERAFIQGLVNRFEHHKHLIWCVAEEYSEAYSSARVSNIAAEIRAVDDYNHVIAVHQHSGLVFDFPEDSNIEQFAIQYNNTTASGLHSGMVTAWNNAAGRYNLNMAESLDHGYGDRETIRKKNWASAMGGAYVMVLRMDIAGTPTSELEDCGRLVEFFESTNFNEMSPRDDLKYTGTQYVLAKPPDSYIAYASNLSEADIGLKNMSAGIYDFKWFDCIDGNSVEQTDVSVAAGNQSWSKPAGFGDELAVYIKKAETSDLNDDFKVDFNDLHILAGLWLWVGPAGGVRADIIKDGIVNFIDFDRLAVNWLNIWNQPPWVNITNPQDGATINLPYEIQADAWDVEGSVVKVEFFADGSKVGEDNNGTDGWKTNWQDYPAGQCTLTAKATDDDGATRTSPAVEIRVAGPPPPT